MTMCAGQLHILLFTFWRHNPRIRKAVGVGAVDVAGQACRSNAKRIVADLVRLVEVHNRSRRPSSLRPLVFGVHRWSQGFLRVRLMIVYVRCSPPTTWLSVIFSKEPIHDHSSTH